jgi:ABC-type dipeptide/oligopeptide/nickel transport system ATPase subunit
MISTPDLAVTLSKGRDAVHAVRGVSFDVAEAERFGLARKSGSGKSIVLRALAGLNRDWAGTATIGSLGVASGDRRLPRIAPMVVQDPCGANAALRGSR